MPYAANRTGGGPGVSDYTPIVAVEIPREVPGSGKQSCGPFRIPRSSHVRHDKTNTVYFRLMLIVGEVLETWAPIAPLAAA